jgi:hypothetical protein
MTLSWDHEGQRQGELMTSPDGLLTRSPRELRDELEHMVRLDLIGPAAGAYEELEENPSERYLLGLLAPKEHASLDAVPDEELGVGDVSGDSGEEGEPEGPPRRSSNSCRRRSE